jgi:hypothetical protein
LRSGGSGVRIAARPAITYNRYRKSVSSPRGAVPFGIQTRSKSVLAPSLIQDGSKSVFNAKYLDSSTDLKQHRHANSWHLH